MRTFNQPINTDTLQHDKGDWWIPEEYHVKLTDEFMAEYTGKVPPKLGELGLIVWYRTYLQIKEDGSMETIPECMRRVIEWEFTVLNFHCVKEGLPTSVRHMKMEQSFRLWWEGKWSPPGRGIQHMGTKALFEKGGATLNNCGFVSTQNINSDFASPFIRLMDFLMLGVGMGFDTRGASAKCELYQPYAKMIHIHVVQDSREGWYESLECLLASYLGDAQTVRFDYSRVREKGTRIRTMNGVASGPEPLRQLLEGVREILDRCVETTGVISATDITDICNMIGVCVVSGNIRRSAEIALHDAMSEEAEGFTPAHIEQMESEEEFLALKDPTNANNSKALGGWRWASNNSFLCDSTTRRAKELVPLVVESFVKNGDPCFVWLDVCRNYGRLMDAPNKADVQVMGCNPCVEQSLEDNELCCLAETFPTNHNDLSDPKNLAEYFETLDVALLYAKVVTLIPTHIHDTNEIIKRNRRVGVSQAGVWELYEQFDCKLPTLRMFFDMSYARLKHLDRQLSGYLNVPMSCKITTVKPGGSVPLLWGIEGGMKLSQSKHYFRTIRFSDTSPFVSRMVAAGIRVEPSINEPQTVVAYFPIESRAKRFVNDVTLAEQATLFTELQHSWSDNQVSATLMFKPDEVPTLTPLILAHIGKWKAVSFLPVDNTEVHPQSPYITITKEAFNAGKSGHTPLDLTGVRYAHEYEENFCSSDKCEAVT